jgi:hypothetical protein
MISAKDIIFIVARKVSMVVGETLKSYNTIKIVTAVYHNNIHSVYYKPTLTLQLFKNIGKIYTDRDIILF